MKEVRDLRSTLLKLFILTYSIIAAVTLGKAQSGGYQLPPQVIVDILDAQPTPLVRLDPSTTRLLILERQNLPSIEEVAEPEHRLAGLRINPRTNGPSRESYFSAIKMLDIGSGKEVPVSDIPQGARLKDIRWSPDGRNLAFIRVEKDGQFLWVVEMKSMKARRLSLLRVNDVHGVSYHWMPDNQSMIMRMVPDTRGPVPVEPAVPSGPIIEESAGKASPARTYQDLLKNPHDEAMFEFYSRAQIVRVNLSGKTSIIGKPDLITQAEPSPDGNYLLVETIHRPFSYLVPSGRFPSTVQVVDLTGKVITTIAERPLAESIPLSFDAVQTGRRIVGWRADAPATLYWVEAADEGDPKVKVDIRDNVYLSPAPFSARPDLVASLKLRFGGILWGEDNLALVFERWQKDRKVKTWLVRPDAQTINPILLFDYSSEDRYNHPGTPLTTHAKSGRSVFLVKDDRMYFSGDGASPEGDRPFLDEFTISTQTKKRLWQSEAPYFERVIDLVDQKTTILTLRESQTEPPNYFVRSLTDGSLRRITDFPHPTPQLANVIKEMIRYKRADGVDLSATLYLPEGYVKGRSHPLLMWAYPQEYKSANAAGQVRDSPYRFIRVGPSSHLLYLTLGYAILDSPTMPIVGEGEREPNDTYVEQLVASAKAAVDAVVARGVTQHGKIAIGGHSYGAFMTANLLAHSSLFNAGIARSGAYNRTLTPFGFQSEERTIWQVPKIYSDMSPFMNAEKIKTPILLIHGEADNNSGTFPMQSERMYNALKGLGATARLVMLPHESHGYRARESLLHMHWETIRWLEQHIGKPD